MKPQFWERQFSLRQVLPDFEEWLNRMQTKSDAVSSSLALRRVAYGDDPRQWVEFCGDASRHPVIPVFIHGGYWRALEAERHRFVLPTLQAAGGLAANVEYRLLPGVSLAEIVDDARVAVRCIAKQTGKRALVIGHSAGGHLASMVTLKEPEHVAGAIAISGLFDLQPLPFSFLADEVGLAPHDVAGLSPLIEWQGSAEHVTAVVGANETAEFLRQAHMFGSTHGAAVTVIEGAHHMSILDHLAHPNGEISVEMVKKLREYER